MIRNSKTQAQWSDKVQQLISCIRGWEIWRQEPLVTMRTNSGGVESGLLALYAYSRYVRRFTIIMCNVLSKVPEADDKFWRLAVNLYDELGGSNGFQLAHEKLIEGARHKPDSIPQAMWDKVTVEMDRLESAMMEDFKSSTWPLILFAIGPGTESISDLFLDPIEGWTSDSLKFLPDVQAYFDVHRPEVEFEHQVEISRVLSEELAALPIDIAESIYANGQILAGQIAKRHFQATYLCWQLSMKVETGQS